MRASDWKLIEDLREKIYGLIDPKDFFASKVVENFQRCEKGIDGKGWKVTCPNDRQIRQRMG